MSRGTFPRLLVGLMALPLLAAPASTDGQEESWKFVVFADSLSLVSETGINTNILGELASAVAQERPAFVLFCGDCTYLPSLTSLSLWTNLMAPVYAAGIPVFPTVGNHEAADLPAFTNFFGPMLPDNGPLGENRSTYFIAHSNALVLVLNEYAPGNDYRVNQPWVDAVLATNSRPHVFAVGHMPAFKLQHPDCLGSFPAERNLLWNALSNAKCRIYFCGHDHFYDHCRLDDGDGNPNNDLHQITVGTGGAPLYLDASYDGTNGWWIPQRLYHEMQYGYVTVTIKGELVTTLWHNRIAANSYAPTSEAFAYSVAPRPTLAWANFGGHLTLTWSGGATLQSAPEPDGSFVNIPGASSPYPLDPLDSSRRFFRLLLQ
jgi:hypothetical protein